MAQDVTIVAENLTVALKQTVPSGASLSMTSGATLAGVPTLPTNATLALAWISADTAWFPI